LKFEVAQIFLDNLSLATIPSPLLGPFPQDISDFRPEDARNDEIDIAQAEPCE
jgi:hypothetical protein